MGPGIPINARTIKVEENPRLLSRHHSSPSMQIFFTGRPNSLTHGLLAGLLHLCSFALGEWDDSNDIHIPSHAASELAWASSACITVTFTIIINHHNEKTQNILHLSGLQRCLLLQQIFTSVKTPYFGQSLVS